MATNKLQAQVGQAGVSTPNPINANDIALLKAVIPSLQQIVDKWDQHNQPAKKSARKPLSDEELAKITFKRNKRLFKKSA